MLIKPLAHKMAVSIKEVVPDHPSSIASIRHSISFLLNVTPIIVLTFLISLFTGKPFEAGLVLLSFGVLRQLSGGIHLKSSELCIVVSVAAATILSFASFGTITNLSLTTVSLVLAMIYAPSRIDGQTKIPKRYYPLLRLMSVLLISSNFAIGSSILAVTFFIQCLTLISMKGGEKN